MLKTVRDYVRWYRKAHPRCKIELRFIDYRPSVTGADWTEYMDYLVSRYDGYRAVNLLVLYLDGEHI